MATKTATKAKKKAPTKGKAKAAKKPPTATPRTKRATSTDSPVEVVAIIDRSGSMYSLQKEAINAFNTFLETQKKEPGEANFTVVLFDTQYVLHAKDVAVGLVAPLNEVSYNPALGGMTALNDAIGRSLNELNAKSPKRAIICILTDGMENASQEFTTQRVKDMITVAKARGWEVVYLAANQDAFAVAQQYAIPMANAANFSATAAGLRSASVNLSASVSAYRGGHAVAGTLKSE